MRVAYKVWLDDNGKAFGDGPYQLLKGVERTGSLRQAAMGMAMSYRKAWLTLRRSEEKLGFALLERKVGGSSGGGSRLTDPALDLMTRYERFRWEAEELLESLFQKHFSRESSKGTAREFGEGTPTSPSK